MPLATEVDIFYTQVGRNQKLVAFGDFKNGGIVADAAEYTRVRPPSSLAADAVNQRFFRQNHGGLTIAKPPNTYWSIVRCTNGQVAIAPLSEQMLPPFRNQRASIPALTRVRVAC